MTQYENLNDLPKDCIYEIASYLGLRDLENFSFTNRRIYSICEDVQIKPLDGGHDLLSYQKKYIKWMLSIEKGELHKGIINLTMGSGKTVCVLTTIQLNRVHNPSKYSEGLSLIILDLSLIRVWIDEIEKFYTSKDRLEYIVYHADYTPNIDWEKVPSNTVILTTPITLRNRVIANAGNIQNIKFHRIIFDEVHCLGEDTATKIKLNSKFDNLWVITGTPFKNDHKKKSRRPTGPSFNKNICALFDCNYDTQYLFDNGKPIETPELHQIPIRIDLFDGNDTIGPYGYGGGYAGMKDKLIKVCKHIEELPANDKCLIFCASREVIHVDEYLIKHTDISYLKYDSSLQPRKREDAYLRFKSDPDIKLLVCSFELASKGLNLCEANHTIFLSTPTTFSDPNIPNTNQLIQALSRIYRYGQKKNCYVQIYQGYKYYSELLHKVFPHATIIENYKY